MEIKTSMKQDDGTCGDGSYCVQLYSRRASLVTEFCLDREKNKVPDLAAAATLLRLTLAPCNFASTTVTLIDNDGSNRQTVMQFNPSQL